MEISKKTLQRIFIGVASCILLYWLLHETERVKNVFTTLETLFAPFIIAKRAISVGIVCHKAIDLL